MSISETFRQWLIQPILDQIKKMEANIMAALDDKIAALNAATTQLGTDLKVQIADLKANSSATPEQLQALDDIATKLTGMDTDVKASDPGPQQAA